MIIFEMPNMKDQVPWLTEFGVGIDNFHKYFQCLCPWWMLDKIKNDEKWDKINKINIKTEIRGKWMINILMYVNIFFVRPLFHLRILTCLAKALWALWIHKQKNLHYWKRKEINSEKTVSQFSIKLNNKTKIGSQHNTMTEMCRALFKYENERKISWSNWLTTC